MRKMIIPDSLRDSAIKKILSLSECSREVCYIKLGKYRARFFMAGSNKGIIKIEEITTLMSQILNLRIYADGSLSVKFIDEAEEAIKYLSAQVFCFHDHLLSRAL